MTALESLAAVARRLPSRRPRAVVLVYHRVGQRGLDPWHLTIEPEIFAGQMETLARDWSPVSLPELSDYGRSTCVFPPTLPLVTLFRFAL